MTGRRAYVAFTPYHLLLALALQIRDGDPPAKVLFADEAGFLTHAPGVATALRAHFELSVTPALESIPKWEYPIRLRRAARLAQRGLTMAGAPDEVFISNGLRPESQRLFKSLSGRTTFNCVEDGLDSYFESNQVLANHWYRRMYRSFNGSVHPPGMDMLEATNFATVHAIVPELCRAPATLVREIPAASLKGASALMNKALPLAPPAMPITDLVVLSNSERIADPSRYLFDVLDSLRSLTVEHDMSNIALKAHPRERNAEFLEQLGGMAGYPIPNWAPLEILSGWMEKDVRVHCGMTTFVLTSRKLLPGRRVFLDGSVSALHARSLRAWDPEIHHPEATIEESPHRTVVR